MYFSLCVVGLIKCNVLLFIIVMILLPAEFLNELMWKQNEPCVRVLNMAQIPE